MRPKRPTDRNGTERRGAEASSVFSAAVETVLVGGTTDPGTVSTPATVGELVESVVVTDGALLIP